MSNIFIHLSRIRENTIQIFVLVASDLEYPRETDKISNSFPE